MPSISSFSLHQDKMESEETLLLSSNRNVNHEEVYKRFTSKKKKGILAIVSLTGLIQIFVYGSFVPSITQIAKDLNSTGPIVSLAISISIFTSSLSGLVCASYSTFYGRKPVYLSAIPLLFLGSLGVASSSTIPQLLSWRVVQAIGASPGLSVGQAVIGDIYNLEERGQAMGISTAVILLGPILAPIFGGFATHYYSWRFLHQFLGLLGLLVFFLILICLPETYHPNQRGVDKLDPSLLPKWRPVIINPLQSLWLLRSPNLLAVSVVTFTAVFSNCVLLVPLPYTIAVRYNVKNEALIGACFLPAGLGSMIGASVTGRLSDRIVSHYMENRGVWYPEDRLRAAIPGALILVPLSVLFSGLLTEYVPGTLGLMLNFVCLFAGALGASIILSPSFAYLIDLMHSRSAEILAANNAFGDFFVSIALSGLLSMIEIHGLVATNTASALLSWLGCGLLLFTIRYGERLRAIVDVGFVRPQV